MYQKDTQVAKLALCQGYSTVRAPKQLPHSTDNSEEAKDSDLSLMWTSCILV